MSSLMEQWVSFLFPNSQGAAYYGHNSKYTP
jgi:hypothetical protein